MNKFLSRVKGDRRGVAAPVRRSVREVNQEDLEALQEFANYRPKQRSCVGGNRKAAQQWSLASASGLRKGLPRNLTLHKIKLNYYICVQI